MAWKQLQGRSFYHPHVQLVQPSDVYLAVVPWSIVKTFVRPRPAHVELFDCSRLRKSSFCPNILRSSLIRLLARPVREAEHLNRTARYVPRCPNLELYVYGIELRKIAETV